MTTFAELTTTRVGGPIEDCVEAADEATLIDAVRSADAAGIPLVVLGDGSNLIAGDDPFRGRVVLVRTSGMKIDADDCESNMAMCGGVLVDVAAGMGWDDFVADAVRRQWVGVEALSGIPGRIGATPIQNVGAYGQEVAQTIARVRTFDRVDQQIRTFAAADCGFSYRNSRFKAEPGRYVVLNVTFQLKMGDLSAPIAYAELAAALGVEQEQRAPLELVREKVLELRRSKGMVLEDSDHDTWSTGSFFVNPVVPGDQVPEGARSWPTPDGQHKLSAAWLIENAGFPKGYGAGPAQLSGKHTLAITNRGQAQAADVISLAREIRDGVQARFGVRLTNEPNLLGVAL
jgi:UDP-N-acetylmuramate dehydrogenase